MNRVWLPERRAPMPTSRAFAPSGTVTKYDVVLLRCTEPEAVKVYEGFASGLATITVARICWSTPRVFLSSSCRMALCTPADAGFAWTLTVTGFPSGRATWPEPVSLKVPSLFLSETLCVTALSGPVVRTTVTGYVFVCPAFSPPSRS